MAPGRHFSRHGPLLVGCLRGAHLSAAHRGTGHRKVWLGRRRVGVRGTGVGSGCRRVCRRGGKSLRRPSAALVGAGALTILPAPIAMLGLSRSPLASVNPVALASLIRVCGQAYLWVPGVLISLAALVYWLLGAGLPRLLAHLLGIYAVFLLFTLTGAVVARTDAVKLASDPIPQEPDIADELTKPRSGTRGRLGPRLRSV